MRTPEFTDGNVIATCPDCAAIVNFAYRDHQREFGYLALDVRGKTVHHRLLQCPVCGRPAVASIMFIGRVNDGHLRSFWPTAHVRQELPLGVPEPIVREIREAESCMASQCWRAAAAMLRSALEKTLKANGYRKGTLERKIDEASDDGLITAARKRRTHDLVRILGNDVLHDDWREVTEDEVSRAAEYVARVAHDFYDDRETVEELLREKKRLESEPEAGPAI